MITLIQLSRYLSRRQVAIINASSHSVHLFCLAESWDYIYMLKKNQNGWIKELEQVR